MGRGYVRPHCALRFDVGVIFGAREPDDGSEAEDTGDTGPFELSCKFGRGILFGVVEKLCSSHCPPVQKMTELPTLRRIDICRFQTR